jgi:hypothetical protein
VKTVVIAGDLIRDFNLVQHPLGPERHHEQLPRTVLKVQERGAWYLTENER